MHQQALTIEPTAPLPPIAQAAADLVQLRIVPLRVKHKGKAPTANAWQQTSMPALDDVPRQFAGQCNLGALLGTPSADLVDVDLDWPEAGQLAPKLLPVSWCYGRDDEAGVFQLRHILLRCPGIAKTTFDAPARLHRSKQGRRIVEILATGQQAVVPPSIHETGQQLRWQQAPSDGPLAEINADQLQQQVARIAGAALLARHWPEFEGSRHDLTAALAGACWHASWPRAAIEQLLVALLQVADDPERRDRARAVQDTLDRAQAGQPITGWPRAAELLGPDMAASLQTWWHVGMQGTADLGLTFGGQTAEQVQVPQSPGTAAADDCAGLTFGGRTAEQATGTSSASTAWAAGMDWPELLEFETGTDSAAAAAQAYPLDALGPILQPAVQALTERQQVPVALAAQSCWAAAAAVVQERFDVICDGRTIPLSLWLVLVALPGERKTSTDEQAFRLIYLRMREAQVRYQTALDAWKAARGDKDADPGPRPRKPTWLLTGCTTEGLVKTLDAHWPALTLTNSDAAAWLGGYSMREGRDTATAAVLSGLWSGSFHAEAKASLDEATALYGRRLSLSMMLQPEVAAALFDSRTLAGQGFLSRCLPAFPPSTIGSRPYRRRTEDDRLHRFEQALDALLARTPEINLVTGELQPQALPLDDAAFESWIAVHDRYESGLAKDYRDIREVANKAPEQVLRLAGVQAALEGAGQVQQNHIDRAARLMDWHLGEWQRINVKLVEHRREVALPKQLHDWMLQRRAETGESVFHLREMYRNGPRMIRNQSQQARELMAELLRRGYVRVHGTGYELRPDDV